MSPSQDPIEALPKFAIEKGKELLLKELQKNQNIKKLKNEKKNQRQIYYNEKKVHSPKSTSNDSNEDEGLSEYKDNGYHPIHIGEILLNIYIIMQKLDWSHFSTCWLENDMKYNNYVAIKVQKSEQKYIDAAYDEVEILQELEKHNFDKEWIKSLNLYWKDEPNKFKNGFKRDHSQVVQLLNSFIFFGQNGRHFCMVFEIMGVTLLEIIKKYNYKGIPIPIVRKIAKQILIGLDYLHRMCGIIHTDLKPENILVCLTKEELKVIKETGEYNFRNKKNESFDLKSNNSNIHNIRKINTSNNNNNNNCIGNNNFINNNTNCNNNNFNLNGVEINLKKNSFKKDIYEDDSFIKKNINKKKISNNKIKKLNSPTQQEKDSINKMLDDIMKKEQENKTDIDQFKIEDLIERPQVQSVPNIKLKYLDDSLDNYSQEENSTSLDYNINEYSNKIQTYIKEKYHIKHDKNYRLNLIHQYNALSYTKNEKEKNEIINENKKKQNIEKLKEKNKSQNIIDKNIGVKICDLGNACWINHHFSNEIQTRQYRSPEVILGINYNTSADIWSFACLIFELIIVDYLFEPKTSDSFSKNDNHLAQIIELLGKMPKKFCTIGKNSKKYFSKDGNLLRIKNLQFWNLKSVLITKYKIKENEAKSLCDFLLPMLEYYPEKRASAKTMLNHYWLKMKDDYDYYINERLNFERNKKDNNFNFDFSFDSEDNMNYADDEDNDKYSDKDYFEDSDDSSDMKYIRDDITLKGLNSSFATYGK